MKRVYIAAALAMSMLFGSSASAGGKSINVQVDSNFISVNWSSHYKQYHQPQHRPIQRVYKHKPIYRPARPVHRSRPIYRPARPVYRPKPIYRHPARPVYRPKPIYRAPRHRHEQRRPARHFKHYLPHYYKWQHKRRARH